MDDSLILNDRARNVSVDIEQSITGNLLASGGTSELLSATWLIKEAHCLPQSSLLS